MNKLKGRGAQLNPTNKFETHSYSVEDEYLQYQALEGEEDVPKTTFLEVYPKTIVNKVTSEDVRMNWSLNPYQGCEHGCVYCFARNSHEYWGYSAGVDFETKIMVKRNAAALLEKRLTSPSWKVDPIVLSGNTDCYQPAERKYELTRACLKVFLKYKHPVGMITKNALLLRDLDIIKELVSLNLFAVNVSITSLVEETRRKLEPRTSSVKNRLKLVEVLAQNDVPVNVMMGPIIPSLNDHELLPIAQAVSELGARSISYTYVRLNGQIAQIFENWINEAYPDRAEKVLNQIRESHGGKLNDSRWNVRMRGEGKYAENVKSIFQMAKKKYFSNQDSFTFNKNHFNKTGQLGLF